MIDTDNGDIFLNKAETDELLQDLLQIGYRVCELELWCESHVTWEKWEMIQYGTKRRESPDKSNISLSTEKVEPPVDNRMEAKT